MKTKLKEVKAENRSVEVWNEMREEFKRIYSQADIYALDTSGYITKWLKGE